MASSIDFDEVLSKSDAIKSVEQEESNNYVKEAEKLMMSKKYRDAISLLRKAIYLDEENAEAYFDLGKVYLLLGNREYAKGLIRTAIKAKSASLEMFKFIIDVYIADKQYANALWTMELMQKRFSIDADIAAWMESKISYLIGIGAKEIRYNKTVINLLKRIIKTEIRSIKEVLREIAEIGERNRDYDQDKADIDAKVAFLEQKLLLIDDTLGMIAAKRISFPKMQLMNTLLRKIRTNLSYIKDGYVLTGAELVNSLLEDISRMDLSL